MSDRWPRIALRDLTTKVGSGATPKGGEEVYKQAGVPFIRSMNVIFFGFKRDGLAYLDDEQADALRNVTVKSDDVLLNITGASIGRVTLAPPDMDGARVNQHVCIIRPSEALDARYLAAFLSSPAMQSLVGAENYGVTRQALTKQQILDFLIPLPSLVEQRRVAHKLDVLLESVEACRARLERMPPILKRFREAVLAAAVTGRLTEDWRDSHPSASIDVPGLLEDRKKLWGELNLKQRGARPSKYRPPFEPAHEHGLRPPPSWGVVTVSALAQFQVGFAFKSAQFKRKGIRLLRGENVEPSRLRWKDVHYWDPADVGEYEHLLIKDGDLILAMDRPIVAAGLKLARVTNADLPALLVQRVMRFLTTDRNVSAYLEICLLDSRFAQFLSREGMTGSDLPHITGNGVAEFPVPVPPMDEMQEIVRRVGELFEIADNLEHHYKAARSCVDALTPSILAKAFRGDLVLQDPNEESSSVLLERILAQRAQEAPVKRAPSVNGVRRDDSTARRVGPLDRAQVRRGKPAAGRARNSRARRRA